MLGKFREVRLCLYDTLFMDKRLRWVVETRIKLRFRLKVNIQQSGGARILFAPTELVDGRCAASTRASPSGKTTNDSYQSPLRVPWPELFSYRLR